MQIPSRPNRISTKQAVISLLILVMLVVGLMLLTYQTVKAADGLPTLTCKPNAVEVFNDSGIVFEMHTYRIYLNGDSLESGPLNLPHNGLFTYYFSTIVYGTYNFQVINPDNVTILTQISCINAEPTQTPTSTNTPTPQPLFSLMSHFDGSGNAVFTIHNYGDSMIYANRYILYESGSKVDEASFYLFSGENKTITFARDPGNYLLNILNQNDVIVAHDTLNNIPATQTFTATAVPTTTFTPTFTTTSTSTVTSTATKTSTVTPTVTATTTSTLTSTLTVTSTVTKTVTKTITTTVTPKTVDSSNNGTAHTQTPTAKPWFWFLKKTTSTATKTFSFTPSPQRPTATPAISATLTPVKTGSTATGAAATPTSAPQPRDGAPLSLLMIIVIFLLMGITGFGFWRFTKK